MPRYVIRVNYPNGGVAWLRHGSVVGAGAIVRFPNRQTAEVNLDLIREGLEEGCIASVVPVAPSVKRKRGQVTSERPERKREDPVVREGEGDGNA